MDGLVNPLVHLRPQENPLVAFVLGLTGLIGLSAVFFAVNHNGARLDAPNQTIRTIPDHGEPNARHTLLYGLEVEAVDLSIVGKEPNKVLIHTITEKSACTTVDDSKANWTPKNRHDEQDFTRSTAQNLTDGHTERAQDNHPQHLVFSIVLVLAAVGLFTISLIMFYTIKKMHKSQREENMHYNRRFEAFVEEVNKEASLARQHRIAARKHSTDLDDRIAALENPVDPYLPGQDTPLIAPAVEIDEVRKQLANEVGNWKEQISNIFVLLEAIQPTKISNNEQLTSEINRVEKRQSDLDSKLSEIHNKLGENASQNETLVGNIDRHEKSLEAISSTIVSVNSASRDAAAKASVLDLKLKDLVALVENKDSEIRSELRDQRRKFKYHDTTISNKLQQAKAETDQHLQDVEANTGQHLQEAKAATEQRLQEVKAHIEMKIEALHGNQTSMSQKVLRHKAIFDGYTKATQATVKDLTAVINGKIESLARTGLDRVEHLQAQLGSYAYDRDLLARNISADYQDNAIMLGAMEFYKVPINTNRANVLLIGALKSLQTNMDTLKGRVEFLRTNNDALHTELMHLQEATTSIQAAQTRSHSGPGPTTHPSGLTGTGYGGSRNLFTSKGDSERRIPRFNDEVAESHSDTTDAEDGEGEGYEGDDVEGEGYDEDEDEDGGESHEEDEDDHEDQDDGEGDREDEEDPDEVL